MRDGPAWRAARALRWRGADAAGDVDELLPIPIPVAFALRIDGRVLMFTIAVTLVAADHRRTGARAQGDAAKPGERVERRHHGFRRRRGAGRCATAWLLRRSRSRWFCWIAVGTVDAKPDRGAGHLVSAFNRGTSRLSRPNSDLIGYDDARAERLFEQRARARFAPSRASRALQSPNAHRFRSTTTATTFSFPAVTSPDDLKGSSPTPRESHRSTFATLGVPIVQGRNFGAADTRNSPRVAIVNEAFATKLLAE